MIKAITCNLQLKAREKLRLKNAIGFGLSSHWLKTWRELLPTTKHTNHELQLPKYFRQLSAPRILIITSPVWRISLRDIGPWSAIMDGIKKLKKISAWIRAQNKSITQNKEIMIHQLQDNEAQALEQGARKHDLERACRLN